MPLENQRLPLVAEESAEGSPLQQVRRWRTITLSLLRRGADRVGALLLTVTVRALNALGLLDDAGELLIGLLVKRGKLGPLTDVQRRTVNMVKGSVYARLVVEGYLPTSDTSPYPEWHALNARLLEEGSAETPGLGVTDPAFVSNLEALTGASFSAGNQVQPLIDGPASFAQRYMLMESAQQSITLATWKVYADETGKKTVDTLLAKRRQNPAIDVRVMVDGNVAARDPACVEQLKRLIDAGIPVAFYHHDQRPFDGFHYKQLVVDGATAHPISIAGGMNIGAEYSHGFGTPKAEDPNRRRWRDTDVRIDGPNARDDYVSFIRLWNEQAARKNSIDPFQQVLEPIHPPAELPPVRAPGGASVMTVIDEPGPESRQTITLGTIRAIRAAQQSVEIENAYFMDVPAIRDALIDAMKRGVRVRVLTNSTDSVDETFVCVPILKGIESLLQGVESEALPAALCEVYVRNRIHPGIHNADTLHSKFMVVDRTLSMVTSFNIHARSLRLEAEGAHFIIDRKLSDSLARQFDSDILAARRYRTTSEIVYPKDLVSRVMRYTNLHPVLV
ncbi:MAG: phosphatidylserine/phosphatidylglycerophosphate/cardiolipin synthase family protein [Methylotetracoccus sp.]|jgi:cardiolipin synthase|nr:phosphatidylserine/phosphatidylglycerophosphate/cardiolipin synthase family protein [Methylotetracoccus sp.]